MNPSNVQVVYFIVKLLYRRIMSYFLMLFSFDHWNIGIVRVPIYEFLTSTENPDVERALHNPPQTVKKYHT
jgi:hypothetical protein